MDEFLMNDFLKNLSFTPTKVVSHDTQTDLEKILSNVAHQPLRLVDFVCSSEFSDMSPQEYKFSLTAVRDPSINVTDKEIPFCDLDCSECDICQEECFDCEFAWEGEPMMWGIPDVDYIIFNDPATIVFWEDGTKTVVKCMEGEKFEKYAGFAMACMKKLFGSTSRAKAIMNELSKDQKEKEKKHETPAE